jgi:hypothetical protein
MVGRELSKFFIEQMRTAMTQRGQLLYVKELHGINSEPDVFDNPDAVFHRCCAMMKHAYDPLGKKAVLGPFSVVGAVGNYILPQKGTTTPPSLATSVHEPRGRKNTAGS